MLFWLVAALVALAALVPVLLPLVLGGARGDRRASFDKRVFRDQLREIDQDAARGVLSADEAEAARVEVSRRLLAADAAEASEPAARRAPGSLSEGAALVLMLMLLAGSAGLYLAVGAPGLGDMPLAVRQARLAEAHANRPGQDEVEALLAERSAPAAEAESGVPAEDLERVEQLKEIMAERPDDLRGQRLLARSLAALGRWPEARRAQAGVIELLGADATADDHVALAEFMVMATNGYVSPEAEASLSRALQMVPSHKAARYYSGLALRQAGRPDLAYRVWSRLRAEGPADAPWMPAVEEQLAALTGDAGQAPPRGPGAAEAEAGAELPAAERQAMIEGMVGGLAERLEAEGGPAEDWARLIRSLGVLGRRDRAEAAWTEARQAFADDPAALEVLDTAARDAGLER